MREFFDGVGSGDNAGVWETTPQPKPEFRERYRKQMAALAKQRAAATPATSRTRG